ncbi:undecaprenyl-phosphate glucose phosphotransferase [Larsenimonas salina]|uniref:undecaprenyl-phosphate glucose phosphotransferase n=1 Tax=Larsenimonas salina TaxID=1295565 RepID=UPI0020744EA9|nr:undecaprenyl-phosphate glucose phosphotransferase [Larsenimonas salina]MCM5704938.1 undecaprenyl-phosphate glucose phosphotransferase [Larsenimonas salina]
MKGRKLLVTERFPLHYFGPVFDALLIWLSGMAAYQIRLGSFELHERYQLALMVTVLLVVLLNILRQAYVRWRTTSLITLVFRLLIVWILVAIAAASLIYFAQAAHRYSRLWLGMTLAISFVLCSLSRLLAKKILSWLRIRGLNRRKVFLIGPGIILRDITRHMREEKSAGFSISGIHRLSQDPGPKEMEIITRRVAERQVHEVWICMPLALGGVVKSLMHSLRYQTVEVRFIPEFSDLPLLNHRVSQVVGLYAIDLSVSPMSGNARIIKRCEDVLLSSLIMTLCLPLYIAIAIAVRCTSTGPVLFKQYRTGLSGRRFKVYKFRSMYVHDEPSGNVTQAVRRDPRFTPVGAFLRKTSLDELPQFFNVLQGRMSIVGPRPHALVHNEYYKELVESYMQRHMVKPGITGWAQVKGYRGQTDTLEKMQNRVEHDLWYIEHWNVGLDILIIFKTLVIGFKGRDVF